VIFAVRRGLARPIPRRPVSRKERNAYAQVPPEAP
jgi:hypothetical protein